MASPNANTKYQQHLEMAKARMKLLQRMIENHEKAQAQQPNDWGWVGDMAVTADHLEYLTDHLSDHAPTMTTDDGTTYVMVALEASAGLDWLLQ